MQYTSINIQGHILSAEILDKIASEDIRHQGPEAFGLARSASIRDEIGYAWSNLRTRWTTYQKRLDTLPKNDTGTSLTREQWIKPFLEELRYSLNYLQKDLIIDDKRYAISHEDVSRGGFPVLVMGYNDRLDTRRETGGPRHSPHSLMQEYLNHTEHLYGIVTNGKQLRLLRDATRLVRLSYLEFDLEKIMEEELYADFAVLYRTLHITRMPEQKGAGEDSIIEHYHQDSLASGTRIREKLSDAVEHSITTLANGFLQHPSNTALTSRLTEGKYSADELYLHLLRLIYRVLFLIVIEERKLIYPEKQDTGLARLRKIYFECYSIERIRKLADQNAYVDGQKLDLWQGLITTFLLFEKEYYGQKLSIAPLGSGLFAPDAIGALPDLALTNKDLLEVIQSLTTFENDQQQLVRVNYSDLDVEEFGSVYEGLLEYDPRVESSVGQWYFSFVAGTNRSSSGSHYTPEELVKPLIKHSLDHQIADKLKAADPERALLSLKVCDVACGSGHILLSAARRIANELAAHREKAEQPSPTYYRAALRDVIKSCVYGVDLNPLAVELCKVALWLEAHNPGEPLNFLDHRIKCGNAIVGLAHIDELGKGIANEAFKALPDDNKAVATLLRNANKKERTDRTEKKQLATASLEVSSETVQETVEALSDWSDLPEDTPEQVADKASQYRKLRNRPGWWRLNQLADIQVAQFFLPKKESKDFVLDQEYYGYLTGRQAIQNSATAMATGMANRKRFFHWFLEFPEVIHRGGFDCILGNPPFLGGQKLTGTYGNPFAEYVKYEFAPIGLVDLVTYFFRRNYSLIKSAGFISLISTNTIAQGDTRQDGLAEITNHQRGSINHAVKSMNWPGLANVIVSLVTIHKGQWADAFVLDHKIVSQITSYLDSNDPVGEPYLLKANTNKSFQGSIVLGNGFILQPHEAHELIKKNQEYEEILFPYLNGEDLNNRIDQSPSRWAINFFNWPERRYSQEEWKLLEESERIKVLDQIEKEKSVPIAPPDYENPVALDYPECLDIIRKLVKPERELLKNNPDGRRRKRNWWLYGRNPISLYKTIDSLNQTLAVSKNTKHLGFNFYKEKITFTQDLTIFAYDQFWQFATLNSTFTAEWAWKNSATLGASTIRLNPSDVFENLPIPAKTELLQLRGESYYNFRQSLMSSIQLGLTKTYNQFHNPKLTSNVEGLPVKAFQKQFGKETWNLYKHLEVDKTGEIGYVAAVRKIEELRRLHVEMDEAVLAAYGWNEATEEWGPAIALRHDFYEVDYLPENDRTRYTIHPEARKEVLKRLLLLNHERWEAEARQGLHDKKTVEKFYSEKGEPIPPEVAIHFEKGTKKKSTTRKRNAAKPKPTPSTQIELMPSEPAPAEPSLAATIDSCVTLRKVSDGSEVRFRIVANPQERSTVTGYPNRPVADPLSVAVINLKAGSTVDAAGEKYEIIKVE